MAWPILAKQVFGIYRTSFSPGAHPLTKEPDNCGYEIEVLFESVFTGNVPLDAIMWLQVPGSIR